MARAKPPEPFDVSQFFRPDADTVADFTEMAVNNKGMYDAYRSVGFTDDQAMALVMQVMSTIMTNQAIEKVARFQEEGWPPNGAN